VEGVEWEGENSGVASWGRKAPPLAKVPASSGRKAPPLATVPFTTRILSNTSERNKIENIVSCDYVNYYERMYSGIEEAAAGMG
jgi:hypothetical protein